MVTKSIITFRKVDPSWAGDRVTTTPASSKAFI